MNYLSSIRWFTNQPPVTPVTNITLPAVYISHYTPSYQPPVQQHQSVRFADVPGSERPGRSAGMAHGPFFFGSIDSIAQCCYKKIFVDRHSVG